MTPATAGMGRTGAGRTDAGSIGALSRMGIVPVVVIDDADQAAPLAEALLEAGIAGAEVTLRTPAALGALAVMTRYPGFVAGAGTVLEPEQVAAAADAGAQYAVSPGFDPGIVAACLGRSLPVLPGAVTATEIQQVRRAGLRPCKFFPAEAAGGLRTLSALAGPFPDMWFVPTGGIGPANAADYLAAPCALAVGGTWMVTRELIAGRHWGRIRELAAQAAALAADRQLTR